uniref:Tetratricopeptide repeat protein n=1 Tax=Neobodo designis TaxID=312471 RepID=A0A7S1MQU6_NEODS|mmetsp:Transcript_44849/g.138359  ORF Transcript_44849/g.138359 Transcript_44849/m.138359 type:complete len:343 (+) Transcript_44849:225-1253(+)|eukprot:CAMPEP_0174829494 /NCGR_PEP_ID=MMETSP1114-20130205/1956_1 /TAXON_ID=312471 /ORGANISM="Neobodo designis, Strain CCAP 1951/1" /LENGTH=342 /DNA_ID=CAMNT_0016063243 /DNA_START=226 /DNA_END=1254 /DNA_ORIENTATION=-
MATKGARMRTESMAMRLSKQPMSEGFILMDKGYNLGAMRLLTFKAEGAPPFQLGACLEAIATITARMGEGEEAQESFKNAADKYALIQQPVLGEVMKIRGVEAVEGTEAALKLADDLIAQCDPEGKATELPDNKTKQNVARAYHLRGDLRMQMGTIQEALADAQKAAAMGWDRVFEAHTLLGVLHAHVGDTAAARASLEKAIALNPNYLQAYEELIPVLQKEGEGARDALLATLTKAIELHPRAALIRAKAFALSEAGKDGDAIAMLDNYLANPPHEETEALFTAPGATACIFLKAKAAIFGDQNKLDDAIAAVQAALEKAPGDEEATAMLSDLTEIKAKAE